MRLSIAARAGGQYVAHLRKHLPRAAEIARTPIRDLSIALVGDRVMSRLHQQFMNVSGPTDVLTFELEHDADGEVIGGEIVICVAEARRQARHHGVRVADEVLLYAVHGLLHLSGFDDRKRADWQAMHAAEDKIMMRLGLGRVFRPATTAGAR